MSNEEKEPGIVLTIVFEKIGTTGNWSECAFDDCKLVATWREIDTGLKFCDAHKDQVIADIQAWDEKI